MQLKLEREEKKMAKKKVEEQNFDKNLEPVLVILLAILRGISSSKKIDEITRDRIIKSLDRAGYSQGNIASMAGVSPNDVNRVLKNK